jgi:HEAT repeat protein
MSKLTLAVPILAVPLLVFACQVAGPGPGRADGPTTGVQLQGAASADDHLQQVMSSRFCATCHPDIYAEHSQNTHGRAFTDEEVRLATGRFSQADCIICHTPRPIFETGIGMNPKRRHHDLEEGNTCMTCHWKAEHDYSGFRGGAECKTAFDPRVGEVEACASCHRNHGTPYQWELAPHGKGKDRKCIDCHMSKVTRPVAVGEAPRQVRAHVFPGARNEAHVRRAYAYDVRLVGNEVVVTITNKGTGHNFPTELKQRSVESLIVVRDAEGKEVARSRMVFRDPYKRPYGLELPVNTQIPSGQSVDHRVPVGVQSGTVDCELHFKHYFPIEDHHPDLAWRLEKRSLVVDGITPSTRPVATDPEVKVVTPEGISPELASVADLVDYARPPIGKVDVDIPQGDSPADIERLIVLFQFPVPQANVEARKRLMQIGAPAVPALVDALGSWDNKTFNQAMAVLEGLGDVAAPAIAQALRSEILYVRLHARELLARTGKKPDGVREALLAGLAMRNALDRSSAADALGALGFADAEPDLVRTLADKDPDVVRAAALALARLHAKGAADAIHAQLARMRPAETRRDLAFALARLRDPRGMLILLAGLDHADDLVRERFFELWFSLTGQHFCYEPLGPRDERLAAIARLQAWWAANGGAGALRDPIHSGYKVDSEVWRLVSAFAGGDGATAAGNDEEIRTRLLDLGEKAVPILAQAMKYPPGFANKRAQLCDVLGRIGSKAAVPALIAALRDPVVAVAAWACDALGKLDDPSALPAVKRYASRIASLAAAGQLPASAGHADLLLAQAAHVRLVLGDDAAARDLAVLLLSEDLAARRTAIASLQQKFGDARGYDPDAEADARRKAAARWLETR